MTKLALSLAALAMLALQQATPARAMNFKSWVSNTGSDANSCILAQPCATFGHAIAATFAGGEVGVLTPGDYGSMIINKSINITNDGSGEAGMQVILQPAISISAGASDVVSLRGLVIDGLGAANSGQTGIEISSASAVHIQNCVIRNFEVNGTGFGITLITGSSTQLFVSDTIIFNNGSVANTGGILINPGGSAKVVLDRVHLENNVFGIMASGSASTGSGIHLVVRDSVISGNAANGIHAVTKAGHAPAFVFVERSSLVNNAGTGILVDGPGALVLVSDSTITRNGSGVSTVNGGHLFSYANNRNNNNLGAEGTATGTLAPF
jgi:hypothetical protein